MITIYDNFTHQMQKRRARLVFVIFPDVNLAGDKRNELVKPGFSVSSLQILGEMNSRFQLSIISILPWSISNRPLSKTNHKMYYLLYIYYCIFTKVLPTVYLLQALEQMNSEFHSSVISFPTIELFK